MINLRGLFVLFVSALTCACGGCSVFVASSGKEIAQTMFENGSRAEIEKMTGKPVSEQRFATPVIAPAETRYVNQADHPTPATSLAAYEYRGRADDLIEFQDLGMLDAMTLFVGEVISFPVSLIRSAELAKVVHHYRVWYSAEDECVAFTTNPQ